MDMIATCAPRRSRRARPSCAGATGRHLRRRVVAESTPGEERQPRAAGLSSRDHAEALSFWRIETARSRDRRARAARKSWLARGALDSRPAISFGQGELALGALARQCACLTCAEARSTAGLSERGRGRRSGRQGGEPARLLLPPGFSPTSPHARTGEHGGVRSGEPRQHEEHGRVELDVRRDHVIGFLLCSSARAASSRTSATSRRGEPISWRPLEDPRPRVLGPVISGVPNPIDPAMAVRDVLDVALDLRFWRLVQHREHTAARRREAGR